MATYILHTNGNANNGGGYTDNYIGTWSQWHSSFDALIVQAGCTISDNGFGNVRITSAGNFGTAVVGLLVYCGFSDTYDDGRYEITAVNANYIDIDLVYSTDVPTVDVRVGGALSVVDEALTLAFGTVGDELLVCCNQTTRTVYQVVAGGCTLDSEGATLLMRCVNDADGVRLTLDQLEPVFQYAAGGLPFSFLEGIFDCDAFICDASVSGSNGIITGHVTAGSSYIYCPRLTLLGNGSDGIGYAYGTHNYVHGEIDTLIMSSFYRGMAVSTRFQGLNTDVRIFHNNAIALQMGNQPGNNQSPSRTVTYFIGNVVGYSCQRFNHSSMWNSVFVGNQFDIQSNRHLTNSWTVTVSNCLFDNSHAEGSIFDTNDDGTYVNFVMDNCVRRLSGGALLKSAGFPEGNITENNCDVLTIDPFVDRSGLDLRVKAGYSDIDKFFCADNLYIAALADLKTLKVPVIFETGGASAGSWSRFESMRVR